MATSRLSLLRAAPAHLRSIREASFVPDLSQAQLDVIAEATDAVVDDDPTRLAAILGGVDALQRWRQLHPELRAGLTAPPGPPWEWSLDPVAVSSSPHRVHVAVPISTAAHNLRLELILTGASSGRWVATIHDLT
jgi:hypothetical protein